MARVMKHWMAAVCCSVLVTMSGPVRAQGRAVPTGQAQTAAPTALPGDAPIENQEDQLKVPLGPPAGTPNPQAKKIVKPILSYDLALEAATTAMQSCLADGYPTAIAVTDEAGNLIVGLSSDGMLPGRIYLAVRKSLAAIAYQVPTSTLRTKFAEDPSLKARITPNMALLPGALPLMVGDRVVGAIAASGSMAYEEEKCAGDGAAKIQARLK